MRFVLCVHGGAGALSRDRLPRDVDVAMRAALTAALRAGGEVLAADGAALDAVEAAVVVLEDAEVFNAGRGSALTSAGTVEMDASIMRGSDRAAGAVAAVRRVVHPVAAARRLLDGGDVVLLTADGADAFAARAGLELADPASFVTPARLRQLERATRVSLDTDDPAPGTVGAVACDVRGGLAAATSTGGMTRQAPGRVGDSPIPGAGVWADDRTCAVSATGEGERILRCALAHEVDARMRLLDRPIDVACREALDRVKAMAGRAGLIAVDARGRFTTPFVTEGMARGVVVDAGAPAVAIYGDEALDPAAND